MVRHGQWNPRVELVSSHRIPMGYPIAAIAAIVIAILSYQRVCDFIEASRVFPGERSDFPKKTPFCQRPQRPNDPNEAQKRGGFSVVSDRAASDLEAFELLGRTLKTFAARF